ncbi:oligosaccharide flippase family protein [Paenibacillus sp. alder61]|uniref:oligosaccharide flippase family protein n=1 Tax=Paenibacillus sp. alder61 TaxID=2862948 RepID=UPI001CD34171|nr:oligosaccharide flippase family protein [Paenibacillus sp. alder61]MCA1292515.1 oligosaccharide flippase family protein [Paenibacillus sp. alder61]
MEKPHLLMQSAIRAGAMAFVKLLGLIGRVILARMVGAEGIGLYQMAYSFYGFVIMLFGGVPTALAIITAKKPGQGWQLLKILLFGFIVLGSVVSLIVFMESTWLAKLLGNSDLSGLLKSMALAIVIAPLLGLLRGYLQGLEQFGIIAASEVIEQAVRIFFMLLIVYYCLPSGIGNALGKGLYATFLSMIFSLLVVTIYIAQNNLNSSSEHPKKDSFPVKWLVQTSFLISITRLLIPASEFLDAIIIPNRLMASGYSSAEATSIFGIITGMALTIVYTPTLITEALSYTLTMRIASVWQRKEGNKFKELLRITMKLSWLWGLISTSFLFVYAEELSVYIFDTDKPSELIKYLSVVPIIVGFREVSTSILWAQDIKKTPFTGLAIGISISTIIHYFVIAIPGYAYIGAAAGVLTMEVVSLLWNLTVFRNKMNFIKTIPSALLDLLVIGGIGTFLAETKPSTLSSLMDFVMSGIFFFSLTGVYFVLRCKEVNKMSYMF